MPISKRKTARNPLNISVVHGSVFLAYWLLAKNPIIKLLVINHTLPFVSECRITPDKLILFFCFLKIGHERNANYYGGNFHKGHYRYHMTPNVICSNSKKEVAVKGNCAYRPISCGYGSGVLYTKFSSQNEIGIDRYE